MGALFGEPLGLHLTDRLDLSRSASTSLTDRNGSPQTVAPAPCGGILALRSAYWDHLRHVVQDRGREPQVIYWPGRFERSTQDISDLAFIVLPA